ncbi:hypothetical protein FQN55_004874 [Onygenales sp. PD_40]|nr:hypothetical protein FQN55_004874 [Onygenales sp. PD_40]
MLFNHIRKVILDQNRPADLSFPNIPSSAGLQLATSFSEDPEIEKTLPRISYNSLTQILTARVRPTNVHDCHQEWLDDEIYLMTRAGFLTHLEKRSLRMRVGTSYQGFAPPYTSSSKQPDTCIVPDDLRLPTVVIETGWTESWPRLNADKDLWLVGGGGSVELVLLIRWSKLVGNKVKGEIQAHGRNAAGNIVLLQTEVK